jgi:precorrin-6Y C5,15-methyltransferase (decarboxylating)
VSKLLRARGLGASVVTVCEAMGGARERLRTAVAQDFDLNEIDPLNTLAIVVARDVGGTSTPRWIE